MVQKYLKPILNRLNGNKIFQQKCEVVGNVTSYLTQSVIANGQNDSLLLNGLD